MSETNKKTIVLSIEEKDGKLILDNGIGQRWEYPGNFSRRVAVASLVYGSMMHQDDEISFYSDRYRITMEVEILK